MPKSMPKGAAILSITATQYQSISSTCFIAEREKKTYCAWWSRHNLAEIFKSMGFRIFLTLYCNFIKTLDLNRSLFSFLLYRSKRSHDGYQIRRGILADTHRLILEYVNVFCQMGARGNYLLGYKLLFNNYKTFSTKCFSPGDDFFLIVFLL